MNAYTLKLYREIRAGRRAAGDSALPVPAQTALGLARHFAKCAAHPLRYDGDTMETADGWTLRLSIDRDEWCGSIFEDCDTYGEFIEPRAPAEYRSGPDGWRMADGRRVYIPHRSHTFADRLKYARKAGMARNTAYLAALHGLQLEAETADADWEAMQFTVTAYRTADYDENGTSAPEYGADYLGGCWHLDSSGWPMNSSMVEYDLPGDALAEARKVWAERAARAARDIESSRPDMYV